MFIFGSDFWGKKQPALTCWRAVNLSMDPIILVFPSGSTRKEIEGAAIWWDKQVGAASMIPPTRQNDAMYSAQDLNKEGIAIMAFLGSHLANNILICSMMSTPGSSYFLFKVCKGLIWSRFREACPLPPNSSSILNIQVWTYKFLAISWAREWINSYSS